ncbi:alpha/beta family hydrolase [Novosphingobium sp. Fuku2-ISO-50]|uniref:alpha/beta family hydrolase n=1 Tax=Novosphingobium sp. Fuku2-ISO-50 TaxID=1739114 RepID=UPI00076D4628|nr:alpha/beta family hydrolase [Novosphingobium sp. Fuku2-ISO-50]KUR76611.1 hypothetical protein AQZ50_13705 [Novosphingobium sp. Fuku2-ISO-50]
MTILLQPTTVPTLVFLGRNDRTRKSDLIAGIARRLGDQGCTLHWFRSDRAQASDRIDQSIGKRWPVLGGSRALMPLHRRLLRAAVKTALAVADRNRWAVLKAAIVTEPVMDARELAEFLDDLPSSQVHVVGHSAGAIVGTMVAAHPKVAGVICFGYPFRHPARPPEPYRTRPLARVPRPLLVLQGSGDIYGSDPSSIIRLLPASGKLVMLVCDHDYDRVAPAEFDKVWCAVCDFLSETR